MTSRHCRRPQLTCTLCLAPRSAQIYCLGRPSSILHPQPSPAARLTTLDGYLPLRAVKRRVSTAPEAPTTAALGSPELQRPPAPFTVCGTGAHAPIAGRPSVMGLGAQLHGEGWVLVLVLVLVLVSCGNGPRSCVCRVWGRAESSGLHRRPTCVGSRRHRLYSSTTWNDAMGGRRAVKTGHPWLRMGSTCGASLNPALACPFLPVCETRRSEMHPFSPNTQASQ
ncbi:hypothetical protein BS50DRAFT_338008 [Corynespora cassiicola Philippines]|uniref:Uncharacterized protein n=1 Tax=Corynespora cassiicola Philippines TaxID=1448308 RepID=A0A2T2NW02_CORCC|nr:hypothetical protein BS50DRAFT_338008 [Corynespora cassiicola Philippines]